MHLRHGVQVWAFILLFGVMIPGMAIQSVFFDPQSSGQVIGSVAAVSLPLAFLLFIEARFRIGADARGIVARSVIGERLQLPWHSVEAVRFRPGIRLVVIDGPGGTPRVRVSVLRSGLPHFARLLTTHVPPERFDARAREVFRL